MSNQICTNKTDTLPTIESGETVTLIMSAPGALKTGREAPLQIKTASGNTFIGGILIGTATDATSSPSD